MQIKRNRKIENSLKNVHSGQALKEKNTHRGNQKTFPPDPREQLIGKQGKGKINRIKEKTR